MIESKVVRQYVKSSVMIPWPILYTIGYRYARRSLLKKIACQVFQSSSLSFSMLFVDLPSMI